MDLQKLQESRMLEMKSQRAKLVEGWKPYIDAVDGYLKAKGKESLTEIDKHNVAQCLENSLIEGAMKGGSRLFEGTTYQSDIAFLGVQLPVIAALLPSLVLNKLGIVQALDRRQAAVFYLDVKYNNAKGGVAANETMMSAQTGHDNRRTGRLYGSSRVNGEVIGTGTGSQVTFTGSSLGYLPVISQLNTIIVSWISGGTTYTITNSATATALTGAYGSGTITLSSGAYSVTIASAKAPDASTNVTIEYRYDYERTTSAIPGVNISLTSSTITAEDFPLRADYTLGASIDLQKAHGLNLEDELVKYLGGEIKFEIDHLGIDLMYNVGADASVGAGIAPAFSGTLGSGQEWIWRRLMFIDNIEAGSNLILAATLRGQANFIVAGNNVARLIRQLAPHFVPAPGLGSIVPTGPYELGTLDGRLVIHDPFLATNNYLLGFKGDNYLFAGFIYAPYIPLMATPTLLTADLKAQKGFLSSAGFKLVNNKMYASGAISGLQS
jgi:hypothetical protein